MTTFTDNHSTEMSEHGLSAAAHPGCQEHVGTHEYERRLEFLYGQLQEERWERRAAERAHVRRRRTATAIVAGAVVAAIAAGGAYLIVDHRSGTSHVQSTPAASGTHTTHPATVTPTNTTKPSNLTPGNSSTPASNVTPAKPNPEIPSGNNTGNMGTGGGPNSQIPSGSNAGNMGTGGGPVS
jgi:hypothetical protein